jgi:hypothetical protein
MKTTSFYFLSFVCVSIICLVFSMYRNQETFETQSDTSTDISKLTTLKKEIQIIHDKVEANAQQTQVDRKYIEKAVERVIEKLNNS